jgi:hypothetical protein
MRKDILVFIITTSIIGTIYGGMLVTKAWADGIYVTIVAWNEEKDSIKGEIRSGRIEAIQDRIDELEWIRGRRALTDKEAWELQKRKTHLRKLLQ